MLILVLWLLIILGVFGITYSASVKSQYDSFQMTRGRKEAYWAARAGIERALADLTQADMTTIALNDKLFDDPEHYKDQKVGPATFSLIVDPVEDGEAVRYGVFDTAARLNINNATEEMLLKMEGMTDEMAQSLLDWRDGDDMAREAGAEYEYYQSIEEPYVPRNGAFMSLRELIRVRGWSPVFRAVTPDPYERFLPSPPESPEIDRVEAVHILGRITAWSADSTMAPDGQKKLALKSATESDLKSRAGLTDDEAKAVVAFQSNLNSALDLFNVTKQSDNSSGRQSSSNSGQKVFDLSRIGEIIDYFEGGTQSNDQNQTGNQTGQGNQGNQSDQGGSGNRSDSSGSGRDSSSGNSGDASQTSTGDTSSGTQSGSTQVGSGTVGGGSQPGKININTAPHEVLMLVPGMSDDLALAIESRREGQGRIDKAGVIASLGADESTFKQVWPWITANCNRFYVKSVGNEKASGAKATIEAVISVEQNGTEIIYWSEN
ncbi:general secretion pathway protein GspK [bacterium]|nr:general secretion pathway protein GspK [bacterium]